MSAAASPARLHPAPQELSPPLALLCAAATGGDFEGQPANEAWSNLIEAAEYHGLSAFLQRSDAFSIAPAEARERLQAGLDRERSLALLLTAELMDLHTRFLDANIAMVPFKGPALAAELYADPADRPFSDLDVVVAKEDIFRARDLLISNGYFAESPVGAEQLEAYSRFACELNFRRGPHVRVELHWGFAPRQFAVEYDARGFFRRALPQRIGDATFLCFDPADQLLLLALHAARHAWCRMIWILDIARLLTKTSEQMAWPHIMAEARKSGIERILLASIALAHRLFAVAVPSDIESATASAEVLRVVDRVIRRFEADLERDPGEFEPVPMWRHRTSLASRERRIDQLRYCVRLFTEPTEQELALLTLPKTLWFGYSLIRFGHVTAKSLAAAWS